MEIETLRNVFSMASVAVADKSLTMTYSYLPEQYFTQTFKGDNKQELLLLLDGSDELRISPIQNNQTKFKFALSKDSGFTPAVFPQIDRLLSFDEIRDAIKQRAIEDSVTEEDRAKNAQVISSFIHDWESDDDLMDQLGNLIDYYNQETRLERNIDITAHKKYPKFKALCTDLMKYIPRVELYAPEEDINGCAEFTISLNKEIAIEGDFKQKFKNLTDFSSVVEISGDLGFKELSITFYL